MHLTGVINRMKQQEKMKIFTDKKLPLAHSHMPTPVNLMHTQMYKWAKHISLFIFNNQK
jgi:hypothetical protein